MASCTYTYWVFIPPSSVPGEVYCFPRSQLIFSFGRRVVYHSKGLWEYNLKSIPLSVCTTILKRIPGLHFYPKSLLYFNGFVSTSSTKLMEMFFFFKFRIFLSENRKIFKLREYWSKPNVLYINGFDSTSSTN